MNVNSDMSGLSAEYLSTAKSSLAEKASKFSRSGTKQDYASATDIVDISESYRTFQLQEADQVANAQNGIWTTSESTKGKFAGSDVSGLRNFLQETGMGLELSSINASRQTIGRRLDDVIRKAGVKLGKDEKISITIDGNNKVKVSGIKDSKRLKEIEKAIAADEKLTQDIRRHYAQGKVNKDIKTMQQTQGLENSSDLFTSRNLRAFVIDDYLQQKTGVTLSDLSAEDGVITGINTDVAALFSEDPELASTVQNILENGEQNIGYSVSFQFQNGSITDGDAEEAAKEKLKAIQGAVIKLVDEYNDNLSKNSAGLSAEDLQKMRIDSVKIRANASGGYEVVGAENMEQSKVDAIMGIVSEALDVYSGANDPTRKEDKLDDYTGGKAVGNFADIVDTLVESHRLEDFDTEEFAHEVEMELNSWMGKAEIVSPAADKAREELNGELGQELGQELRSVLEENGVNVGNGIEVEVNSDGRIKVVGDMSDPNLQAAQRVLDTFSKDALGGKMAPGGSDATSQSGSANGGANNADKIKHVQELNNETNPGGISSPNIAKFDKPEYTDRDDGEVSAAVTADSVASRYRDYAGVDRNGSSGSFSRIQAPRFMSNGNDSNFALRPNEGFDGDPFSTMKNEHMLYNEDATGIFQHMVDSLNHFHDGNRGRKISFTIA